MCVRSTSFRASKGNEMNRKIGVIAALAAVAARATVPDGSFAQTSQEEMLVNLEIRCDVYKRIDDRAELQLELEKLLVRNPDDGCVDYIIDLLGGGPLASVPVSNGGGGGLFPIIPTGNPGVTSVSYPG